MSRRWFVMGLLGLLVVCGLGAGAVPAASARRLPVVELRPPETTALEVRAAGPPRYVYGSDGRTHVDYDLVITNTFTTAATLTSLTVSGDGSRLLHLTGGALADHTHQFPIAVRATDEIPPSAAVVTLVDVVLPRSAGRHAPARLTNRIEYSLPPHAPFRAAIGSTTIHGPILRTTRRAPVVIASPLRGSGWFSGNGCCAEPSSAHRSAVLVANGSSLVTIELFAQDWIKLVNGDLFRGDGSRLSDWYGFGTPVYAAANGTVVSAINDRPEAPVGAPASSNPTVEKPKDFGGNQVVEKIGRGLYAGYEHLMTGSVMVRPGERLRTGQPIGRLGNTGNSSGPHLHFGIQDGPDLLTSNSLPFEIDHYTVQGVRLPPASTDTHIVVSGPPRQQRRTYPLVPAVSGFAAPSTAG
jgi:Peptidase family M23